MRKWKYIKPFKIKEDAVAFAVIIDKKEKTKKYVAIRKKNAGLFVYSENGEFLGNETYRPYFIKLIKRVIGKDTTDFVEAIRKADALLRR